MVAGLVVCDPNPGIWRLCANRIFVIGKTRKLTIPLYHVLWTDVGQTAITLKFAEVISKSSVKTTSLAYPFGDCARGTVEGWASSLLGRAYSGSATLSCYSSVPSLTAPDCIPSKRFKVIINPYGGSGQAANIFHKQCRALLEAANCELDVENTQHSQHAVDIAEKLDIEAYDGVICCSGDGVPHEVFNGFSKRKDAARALKKIAVCQLPGGSGNAMCWNLTGTGSASLATVAIIKGSFDFDRSCSWYTAHFVA